MNLQPQADIVSSILKELAARADVGVRLVDLDIYARELIEKAGATSYNLGYKPTWAKEPYPAALVTSVNNCIAHGIPTTYTIKDGDLLNLDLGIKYNELCGDAGFTVPIGHLENKHERMLRYAKRALYQGIKEVKAGVKIATIGDTIQRYVRLMGYVVNKNLSGHGIGEEMHQSPAIPHFWEASPRYLEYFGDKTLEAGQVICLEPMVTFKDEAGYLHQDGWSYLTRDGKASVMFEHMIEVLPDGYRILTSHFDEGYMEN